MSAMSNDLMYIDSFMGHVVNVPVCAIFQEGNIFADLKIQDFLM